MQQPPDIRPQPEGEHPLEIVCENVRKSFGDHEVLRGVDLRIHRGEMVAIVGGSGSGKTVLLEHLFGAMFADNSVSLDAEDGANEAETGRVLVADHGRAGSPLVDLATLDEDGLDRVRAHWAVVFQRNALFSGTVSENIALWLREVARLSEKEIAERVREAITQVGLDPDKEADKHRDKLSGGMAKRVAVARAVAMRPAIMFYDEPTTGLDPQSASLIHELIHEMHETPAEGGIERTSVVVTHDKDLLRRLRPRIVMLHGGRVFFDGPYGEFERSDSPIIRPYFEHMPVLHERVVLDRP